MIYSLAILTFVFGAMTATPQPLSWQVDYGKALAEASSKQRPLILILDVPVKVSADSQDREQAQPTAELQTQAKLLKAYQRCHVDVTT